MHNLWTFHTTTDAGNVNVSQPKQILKNKSTVVVMLVVASWGKTFASELSAQLVPKCNSAIVHQRDNKLIPNVQLFSANSDKNHAFAVILNANYVHAHVICVTFCVAVVAFLPQSHKLNLLSHWIFITSIKCYFGYKVTVNIVISPRWIRKKAYPSASHGSYEFVRTRSPRRRLAASRWLPCTRGSRM